MGTERDLQLLRDINTTASQLVLAITNAIDETSYDLEAAAFSETTNITNDYILDNVEFNFTTAASRNITITTEDGTQIYSATSNTDTHLVVRNFDMGFNGGENLTVDVSQAGSACVMDCILKVRSGTNTLVGDPTVQGEDVIAGGNYSIPLDRGGRYLPTIVEEHTRIHEGIAYICTGSKTGLNTGDSFDILLRTQAGNRPHLRVFKFDSSDTPAEIYFYKSPTVTDDGSAFDPVNLDDNSSNSATVDVFTEPTISAVGTLREYQLMAGAKNTGGSGINTTVEHVLKPSTEYLIRFTAGANGTNIGYYLFFYEPS